MALGFGLMVAAWPCELVNECASCFRLVLQFRVTKTWLERNRADGGTSGFQAIFESVSPTSSAITIPCTDARAVHERSSQGLHYENGFTRSWADADKKTLPASVSHFFRLSARCVAVATEMLEAGLIPFVAPFVI